MIRVLLADDQKLIRAGFRVLLEAADDITVIGEAVNGEEAVALAGREHPDVILMDIRMPGTDGLAATRQIAADAALAATKIVILTTFETDEYLYQALRAGASGFLVKDAETEDLIRAVRVVHQGEALLSPSVTRRLIASLARRAQPGCGSAGLDPGSPQTAPAGTVNSPEDPGHRGSAGWPGSTGHSAGPGARGGTAGFSGLPGPGLSRLTEREREVLSLVAQGLSNDELARRLYLSPLTTKTHVSHIMTKLGARDRAQLVVFAYESGLVVPGTTE